MMGKIAIPPFALALLAVGAVTLWRITVLFSGSVPVSFDEAQYWAWAQSLQFGYYSKPPLVAWAIAATTSACGDGAGCVKLGSTLIHAGTALVLYVLGRDLFGVRVGLWSAVMWAVMPAVSLSSMLISTDPFLLFFWALSLWALVRAIRCGAAPNRWWVLLGVAFGLGLLSKYAMVLFAASVALWLAWSPEHRRMARAPGLWLAAGLGLLVYAPNVAWNALNGFVSYAHTKDNANLGGDMFRFDKLAEFVGGQFGVFGPILMAALIVALVGAIRRPEDDRWRMLAAFTVPVLALMTVESFLSRANANWSAPAFVAGTVLVTAFLARRAPALLVASLVLHLTATGILYNLDALREVAGVADKSRFDPMKKLRGWDEVGEQVGAILAAHPDARLMGDERKAIAPLVYYVRPHPFNVVKWNPSGRIDDHFDQISALQPGEPALIYVTQHDGHMHKLLPHFEHGEKLAHIRIPLYGDYARAVQVWRLEGFKGYGP